MEMKQVYENANERMHKTIRALNGEYDSIRAGRAMRLCSIKSRWITMACRPRSTDGGDFRGGSPNPDHPALGCFHPARY